MTAKSGRKSPSRLITCASHTRRITVSSRTSRNVIGAGSAWVWVAMGVEAHDIAPPEIAESCGGTETEEQRRRIRDGGDGGDGGHGTTFQHGDTGTRGSLRPQPKTTALRFRDTDLALLAA